METVPLAIIGGGVVGLTTAWKLLDYFQDITLLEKNNYFGQEQSTHNAGVIHCGIYSLEEPLKKELCIRGSRLLYEFCQTNAVPCQKTGKLIVARDEEESKTLEDLFLRGTKEGLDLRFLTTQTEITKIEPNVRAYAAIYCPETGIIDASSYVNRLVSLLSTSRNGVHLLSSSKVTEIIPTDSHFTLTVENPTERYQFRAERVINSAGLYSDEIARLVNPNFSYTLVPIRGEFYSFRIKQPELQLNSNVYPTPKEYADKSMTKKNLGVHLTPTFNDQEINVGPYFQSTKSKNDYSINLEKSKFFCEQVKYFFPHLTPEKLQPNYSGVHLAEKSNFRDFIVEPDMNYPNFINLVNMGSPALTSSLAIAEYVQKIVLNYFKVVTFQKL